MVGWQRSLAAISYFLLATAILKDDLEALALGALGAAAPGGSLEGSAPL